MDRVIRHDMATYHVPGLAFIAVRDGKILFARGYGYANLARRQPVVPSRTVFHLGAVSTTFTTAAVLQRAERGRVNLHRNVNRYLTRFHLATTYRRPMTLANLLTNTSGLAVRHIGRRTLNPSGVPPLGPYLAAIMPPRIEPPGAVYSYNAVGFTLAGYIVQSVSRLPFARAVARSLFRPLGMRHSSFAQPPPRSMQQNLATGYDQGRNGAPHPAPEEYFDLTPAEGMAATATDVSRFLLALLDGGHFKGKRILRADTVRAMEAQHFTGYPRLRGFPPFPAVAYGFGRYYHRGKLLVEQSGTVRGFSDLLALVPRQRFGFFIAGTIAHDSYLFDLQRRLLARAFPHPRRPVRHPAYRSSQRSLNRFAGSYWSDEYAPTTIEKLRQLVNQVQVTPQRPETLIAHFWTGQTVRVRRVAPLLFQAGASNTFWAFQLARGRVIRMIPGGNEVYDKITWYESTAVQLGYLAGLVLIFLSGVIVWLIVPLTRRQAPLLGVLAGLVSGLALLFLALLAAALWSAVSTQAQHYSWLEYGAPPWAYGLLSLPLLSTALTPLLLSATIVAWRVTAWPLALRLHHSLVALAALAFIPFLLFWNLLGFHL